MPQKTQGIQFTQKQAAGTKKSSSELKCFRKITVEMKRERAEHKAHSAHLPGDHTEGV